MVNVSKLVLLLVLHLINVMKMEFAIVLLVNAHINPRQMDFCNDGNACTQDDSCQSGICIGSNPIICNLPDQCHDAGTCDPTSGVCSNPTKANGTTCNDGNSCTQQDNCLSGTCIGSNPVICTALDQCHVAGTCDSSSGICNNPAKDNGVTCDDGNSCTLTDTCQSGFCTGSNLVVCTASDQCHNAGVCNPSNGVCSDPTKDDGSVHRKPVHSERFLFSWILHWVETN